MMTREQEVLHALGLHNYFDMTSEEVVNWDKCHNRLSIDFPRRICESCFRVEAFAPVIGWVEDGLLKSEARSMIYWTIASRKI